MIHFNGQIVHWKCFALHSGASKGVRWVRSTRCQLQSVISRGKWILGAAYDFFSYSAPLQVFFVQIKLYEWLGENLAGRQSILKEKWQRASRTTFRECRWHLRWNLYVVFYSFSVACGTNKKVEVEKRQWHFLKCILSLDTCFACMYLHTTLPCKKFTLSRANPSLCVGVTKFLVGKA